MISSRAFVAPALAVVLVLVWTPVSHAASGAFGLQMEWLGNHSITLQSSDGHSIGTLKVGHTITIRRGADVLTLSLQSASTPSHPPALPPDAMTLQLLKAINADRAAHGAHPLHLDTTQSQCSLRHSRHMAAEGYISHDQFPADICVARQTAGENVGEAGGDPLQAVLWLHRSMMSEGPCPDKRCPGDEFEAHGHFLNLVNPAFRRVGIGIYTASGTTWLTEDFTD